METSIRLIYQKFSTLDRSDYILLQSNDQVMEHISGGGLTESAATEKFNKVLATNLRHQTLGYYSVKNKSTDDFIGLAKIVRFSDLEIELGYALLPEQWGNGYATEIVTWLLQCASTKDMEGIIMAIVSPGNINSKKVLIKNKFSFWKNDVYENTEVEFYRYTP